MTAVDAGCCARHIVGLGVVGGGGGGGAALAAFQIDSVASVTTNSTGLVTLDTLAGDAKVISGSLWKINYGLHVTPNAAHVNNAETIWSIETSTDVFTEFDRWSLHYGVDLSGDQKGIATHLQKDLTPSMSVPRMRCEVHRITSGPCSFTWSEPRWGGVRITEAP